MSLVPSRKSILTPPHWPEDQELERLKNMLEKGVPPPMASEAAQGRNDLPPYLVVRVEAIENGFVIEYSAQGVTQRKRFASDLKELGSQIVVAAVEVKLRGTEGQ